MKRPLVSIIIPFYNACNTLEALLNSLVSQSYDVFEVILVNNNSSDNGNELISCIVGDDERFKVCDYTEKPSSYASRNYGYRHSKGEILLFTDSDCCPNFDWVENAVLSLCQSPNIILSGNVELDIIDKSNIWEVFDKVAHMKNEQKASRSHVATANMAIMRNVFNEVGLFKDVVSGGDYEWSERAFLNGYSVEYKKGVIVHHPTRKTKMDIRVKLLRIAYGQYELSKGNSWLYGFFKYSIKTANPLRVLIYSYKVKKIIGIKLSVKFFLEFYFLCLWQCYIFFKGRLDE